MPNIIIASGPVIVENNKVLLNKHGDDNFWKFPGGKVEDFDLSLEEIAKKEVKEEMGIDVRFIKPLKTMLIPKPNEKDCYVILVHFLAERIGEIRPGKDILEWKWIDVDNLPEDCAPNVKEIVNELKSS